MNSKCSAMSMIEKDATQCNAPENKITQWRETPTKKILYAPKEETMILLGGLTNLQDKLIETALCSLSPNFIALPNPNLESFQKGKAFGNRGQC
ncbi:MAG: hypothetical protein P8Y49_09600, partial [Sulfurovaceae bacterium]